MLAQLAAWGLTDPSELTMTCADPRTTRDHLAEAMPPEMQVGPLLELAASLDPADVTGWEPLRAAAIEVTSQLAAAHLLPRSLVVEAHDPPVVVARTLAVADRRARRTPGRRDPRAGAS